MTTRGCRGYIKLELIVIYVKHNTLILVLAPLCTVQSQSGQYLISWYNLYKRSANIQL